jgi:hypothetical protein
VARHVLVRPDHAGVIAYEGVRDQLVDAPQLVKASKLDCMKYSGHLTDQHITRDETVFQSQTVLQGP